MIIDSSIGISIIFLSLLAWIYLEYLRPLSTVKEQILFYSLMSRLERLVEDPVDKNTEEYQTLRYLIKRNLGFVDFDTSKFIKIHLEVSVEHKIDKIMDGISERIRSGDTSEKYACLLLDYFELTIKVWNDRMRMLRMFAYPLYRIHPSVSGIFIKTNNIVLSLEAQSEKISVSIRSLRKTKLKDISQSSNQSQKQTKSKYPPLGNKVAGQEFIPDLESEAAAH